MSKGEYFDTPVLVFSANAGGLGERARKLIADCPAPMTTPHALAEFFNALTYRLGFPPKEARKLIAQNTAHFSFVPLDEADYRALLAMCQGGQEYLARVKRFDMPGFRPRLDWVREMKRYGILSMDTDPAGPIDYYAVEQRYWRSLWFQPNGQ